jgi:predicted DNA-binding transcriptional regulator YafY
MPKSDSQNKADRHYRLQKLFEQPGQRLRTREIAERLGVSEDIAKKDIDELDASHRLPLRKDGQYWILAENSRIPQLQVHLNYAEATALYVAGRQLSQIHDERNRFVVMALTKLVDALPEPLHKHQRTLIELAEQRQKNQPDRSAIFEALAMAWTNRCKVRLLYAAPRKRKYECLFSPYLLEPSGIGRTIYAIGHSDPPGELRTYKFERIESATLTKEQFTPPEDFDGPTLLNRAWGVMFDSGDEDLITVRLRFSHYVTPRVRETLWHPSQEIVDTPVGCELLLCISKTLELENWIRVWGSDCEVLEPAELRQGMIKEARRLAHMYDVLEQSSSNSPDTGLLGKIFKG